MVEYPAHPIQIEIQVEHNVTRTYTVNCGGIPQEVAADQAENMASALHSFLSNPDNIKGEAPGFHPFLQPPPPFAVAEGASGIYNGLWNLTCREGPIFTWMQRLRSGHIFTARLYWNEDTERWFIRGLRLGNIGKR